MSSEGTVHAHYLGPSSYKCPSCHALHWIAEKKQGSPVSRPTFAECCRSGEVDLPLLDPLPAALRALYDGEDRRAKEFRKHIRLYNSALAFTSTGGPQHLLASSCDSRGPPHYKFTAKFTIILALCNHLMEQFLCSVSFMCMTIMTRWRFALV